MTLRVHISPTPAEIGDSNGIGRIVHAQYRDLPRYGVELVGPDEAEVIAVHTQRGAMTRVDVLHCHGLYWDGDPGSGRYSGWHREANARVLDAARRAHLVTVPSDWVAEPFRRDMRIRPTVIGHGVDIADWEPTPHRGYTLWNKNRDGDVCDPRPAAALARAGYDVVATFGPTDERLPHLHLTGVVPHEKMRELVRHAEVYLATTCETFGIGTLEAMAAGVPVLGYAWGSTAELVRHGVDGWLVEPGDEAALLAGLALVRERRDDLGRAARDRAAGYTWDAAMRAYAEVYERAAELRRREARGGAAVIIPCYNYGPYVGAAIASAARQTLPPAEIIVVDDGSTDDSRAAALAALAEVPEPIGARLIEQSNQGVAAARNAGIAATAQPFVVCLDADDELAPEYLASLVPALREDRALGVAYGGLMLLSPDGGEAPSAHWPPPFDWSAQAAVANPPATCIPSGSLFRRAMWERAGGYVQAYAPGEDAEFWTRGLSVGFTARRVTPEPLFRYRLHEGSASRTKPYRAIDDWHPWMRDGRYPMAAPARSAPPVRSYHRPAATVVIPVGPGHGRRLPAALDSLLGQTCRSWEVVVVNDSGEPLGDVLRPYPFARVVETPGRQGAGRARNVGLEQVRTPLVLWLDADDYLLPEALEKMLALYAQSEGRYIYTDWIGLEGDGRAETHQAPDYEPRAWLAQGQHAVTVLMATDHARAVGGFDEEMIGWEDWDFFIKLAIGGYHGRRLPEALMVYRYATGARREDSLRQRDDLLALLDARYGDYRLGRRAVMGCCGQSNAGRAIQAARQAGETTPEAQPAPGGWARMEYDGARQGTTTYYGTDRRRSYRGGLDPASRYADVHPDDVALLQGQGWRIVRQSAPQTAAPAAPEPPPPLRVQQADGSWVELDGEILALPDAGTTIARDVARMQAMADANSATEATPEPETPRARQRGKKG